MGRRSVTIGPAPEPARSIRDEVNELPELDIKMLRQKWRGIMGKTAPPHIGKPLMVRILAYRIQANAYGDLPREVAAFLHKLGAGTPGQDNRAPIPILHALTRSLSPGTMLTREWNGGPSASWCSLTALPGTARPLTASPRSLAPSPAHAGASGLLRLRAKEARP